jgi:hypothetical protein
MLAVTVAFGLAAIPAAVQTRRARRVADAAGQGPGPLRGRTAERALAGLERVVAELLSAS